MGHSRRSCAVLRGQRSRQAPGRPGRARRSCSRSPRAPHPERSRRTATVARHVHHGAVPLAVLAICGRFEHACSVRTGTLELSIDVLDPDTDEVRHPIVRCWLLAPVFGGNQCSVCADAHLSPVTVAYPRALDEAASCAEPGHCGPHVRVGKDGHDGRCAVAPRRFNGALRSDAWRQKGRRSPVDPA